MTYYPCSSDKRYTVDVENGRYIVRFAGTVIADVSTLGQAALRATTHRIGAPSVVEQRA